MSSIFQLTKGVERKLVSVFKISTPYNVGSVLWRLFSTLEVVQYIGGIASVLWGLFSTVGE